MPLIISAPGFDPGRSASVVELLDIYPTVSELTGLTAPNTTQGASLVPVMKNPKASVKPGAISFAKGTSWRTKDWAYIRYKNGEEELYDMQRDPDQITNLAGESAHREQGEQMAQALSEQLRKHGVKR